MTTEELFKAVTYAAANNSTLALVSQDRNAPFPKKGWPKGELLCVNEAMQSIWRYDAHALLAALERHKDEL